VITLRLVAGDEVREVKLKSLEAACSRLCVGLPIDIRYGQFSLMTCVEFLPRDLGRYQYPELSEQIDLAGSDYVLFFKSVASNGSLPIVLDDEFVASIKVISQFKRCRNLRVCGTCQCFNNCVLER